MTSNPGPERVRGRYGELEQLSRKVEAERRNGWAENQSRVRSWLVALFVILSPAAWVTGEEARDFVGRGLSNEWVSIPYERGAARLRFFTTGTPQAPARVNTLELECCGEVALPAIPIGAASEPISNLLIDGRGPINAFTNTLRQVEEAHGPEWSYASWDLTPAYRDRVLVLRRGILFVEPDVFVIYDHLGLDRRIDAKVVFHLPKEARIDPIWHDLRWEGQRAMMRVSMPAERGSLREWQRVDSSGENVWPGTMTVQSEWSSGAGSCDVLTVIAVSERSRGGKYDFKRLEARNAVGVRIHRDGYPTLVAFRVNSEDAEVSLTGFRFRGPVGVSVYRPRK